MLVCAVGIALIERARVGEVGEFVLTLFDRRAIITGYTLSQFRVLGGRDAGLL